MEMERDSFISHGSSGILVERMCRSSDAFRTVICEKCGTIPISSALEERFVCRRCGQQGQVGNTQLPFAQKVLVDLLAGAGLRLRYGLRTVPPEEAALEEL